MLESLHARVRGAPTMQRFTALTRVLLAIAFIPPGLTKLLGNPFTVLPTSTPVGYFFDAFFQADEYYRFVGLAQVAAALLLLFPRTATLGALVYFPIIVNIMIITLAIGFQGTWVITILMTLACLYLLAWDYPLLAPLVGRRATTKSGRREYLVQAASWAGIAMAVYGVAAVTGLALLWSRFGVLGILLAAGAGAVFGCIVAWQVGSARALLKPSQPVR